MARIRDDHMAMGSPTVMGIPWKWHTKLLNRGKTGNLKHNEKLPAREWEFPLLPWELIPTDVCSVAEFSKTPY